MACRAVLALVLAVGVGRATGTRLPASASSRHDRPGPRRRRAQDLGCAQVVAAATVEVRCGPLARRAERGDLVGDPSGSGPRRAATIAASVAFGLRVGGASGAERGATPRRRRCGRADATPPSEISPVVIVPVLSRQRVSTRASSSTEASSLASACRRASAMTPAMNARLVSSTRPSGTIATAAATVPWSASCQPRPRRCPAGGAAGAATRGGMMNVSHRRIVLTPLRSSLSASLKTPGLVGQLRRIARRPDRRCR